MTKEEFNKFVDMLNTITSQIDQRFHANVEFLGYTKWNADAEAWEIHAADDYGEQLGPYTYEHIFGMEHDPKYLQYLELKAIFEPEDE